MRAEMIRVLRRKHLVSLVADMFAPLVPFREIVEQLSGGIVKKWNTTKAEAKASKVIVEDVTDKKQ
jgi:hypothetical protein